MHFVIMKEWATGYERYLLDSPSANAKALEWGYRHSRPDSPEPVEHLSGWATAGSLDPISWVDPTDDRRVSMAVDLYRRPILIPRAHWRQRHHPR